MNRIVKDWSRINVNDPKHRKKLFGAFQHFCQKSLEASEALNLQHATSKSDFPDSVLQVLDRYREEATWDDAWRRVFRIVDATSWQRNGFTIRDVGNGLTFRETPIGAPAHIYKFAGEETEVTFKMYSGGLGWHRTLFDDRDWLTIEDNGVAFRNKWFKNMADIAYALIEAVPTSNTDQALSWQSPDNSSLDSTSENYYAIRDMKTINEACIQIITDLEDSGLEVGTRSQFVLLYPMQLHDRIRRAMGVMNAGISGSMQGIDFNITPVMTHMLSATDKYYVCLPGQKAIWANRMNLTIFDKFDPETYSDIAVGWGRYGGAVGEPKQIVQCATS
jgi:hypothetical protein